MILTGDCRTLLATLPAGSVQCCVTSPPYYNLRDYGNAAQIGLERTPDAYAAEIVAVFAEVRRVLTDDGVCWINIGDSYSGSANSGGANGARSNGAGNGKAGECVRMTGLRSKAGPGIKPKDLLMIPARVAMGLQADGWWLRSEIIWHKPNPMPESCKDRPTSAHEKVFLLTKRATYYYDADAIREPASTNSHGGRPIEGGAKQQAIEQQIGGRMGIPADKSGRNARNVWTITPKPFMGAHFATMPPELVERCIKAGSRPGDTILDPFAGAGTTALVASRLDRKSIGIELNPEYAAMARQRVQDDAPMFAAAAE